MVMAYGIKHVNITITTSKTDYNSLKMIGNVDMISNKKIQPYKCCCTKSIVKESPTQQLLSSYN